MGDFLCGLQMIKRFVKSICIVSSATWKLYARYLDCISWKNFCWRPYRCFSVTRAGIRKWRSWKEIVQLVGLHRSELGKHFLRRATLKSLLLPVAAYVALVYFSYNLRFKIWINDNIVLTLYCFISHWHCSTHRWNKTENSNLIDKTTLT